MSFKHIHRPELLKVMSMGERSFPRCSRRISEASMITLTSGLICSFLVLLRASVALVAVGSGRSNFQ